MKNATNTRSRPTVAKVLAEREDLLVEFAVEKGLRIASSREKLGALRGQTLFHNARSAAWEREQDCLREYLLWLGAVAAKLGIHPLGLGTYPLGKLRGQLEALHPSKKIAGIDGAEDGRYGYAFGIGSGRDPWREISVKAVRSMLNRVNELIMPALLRFRRPHEDVLIYLQGRIRGGMDSQSILNDEQLVEPVSHVIVVTLSTDIKRVCVGQRTPPYDDRVRTLTHEVFSIKSPGTWDAVIEEVCTQIVMSGKHGVPTLVAINAPLGWPLPMTRALAEHEAGGDLSDASPTEEYVGRDHHQLNFDEHESGQDRWRREDPNRFFRGQTEQAVREEVGLTIKKSRHEGFRPSVLDAGADNEHESGKDRRWREDRNRFFRRQTEQVVREEIGLVVKKSGLWGFGPSSLDVGSDKSARTAHQALRLLQAVRTITGEQIPVITNRSGPIVRTSAIEVHTYNWSLLPRDSSDSERKAADAMASAQMFLQGSVICPNDRDVDEKVAQREGWIWWPSEAKQQRRLANELADLLPKK